jgi:hypothetical protein
MEKKELRRLIYSALRSQPQNNFSGVKSRLRNLSVEYETDDDLVVHEVLWELLIQGILAPGMNASNLEFPYIHVTEYGMKVLEANQILPYDYDGYQEVLKKLVGETLDPVVDAYARESVGAFISGHYLAAVEMLGVAANRLMDMLANSYTRLWGSHRVQQAFETRVNQAGRNLSHRFGLLRNALEGMDLPDGLQNSIEDLLSGLYTMLRYSRDDSGQPTGRPVDREIAHANLLLFPGICKNAYEVIERIGTVKTGLVQTSPLVDVDEGPIH